MSLTRRNDRSHFYKYYSPEAAEAVLRTASLKWSSPLEFNDPFDNQFHLDVDNDNDRFAKELTDNVFDRIEGKAPISGNGPTSQMLEWMRTNLKGPITPEMRRDISEKILQGMAGPVGRPPRFSDRLREYMQDTSIFCASEKYDDILMWSHYGRNHTGAVMKFLCIEESPLTLAQKVMYSDAFPIVRASELFELETLPERAMSLIALTKSTDWQYEQEWRVVTTARDKSRSFEFVPFNRKELGAVYLGCRMKDEDRRKIVELVRDGYPWSEIHQATKNERRFALDFNTIV